MKQHFFYALTGLILLLTACDQDKHTNLQPLESQTSITSEMIELAQNRWIDGLVSIGNAHSLGEDVFAAAGAVLEDHYDYSTNTVLFKPTLATGDQTFRPTFEGALSYFVGGNDNFPDDSGFALKPYIEGTVQVADTFIHDSFAIAMSKITLKAADDTEVTVDKTFAYRLDSNGDLRIIAHHSSLPFEP